MSDTFFLVVGIILACIGLLLIAVKVMTYVRCTVPIEATIVKLEKEYTYFRGISHTYYRPTVQYVVDGKTYTQEAHFRTYRGKKYPLDSAMKICYNSENPEEMRFVGHPFPLPMGLVFLCLGAILIFCCFL